ncbi:MAG: helix-turn-helix transcriptional regulator [Candidatus Solibacter usitatus]|nr:helix-turn-helix transcriptional regulator [Candidatus Solibacter usitatus]
MPARAIVSKELANLLGALAHPHRIRIIAELGSGELDVNSLQRALETSHSSVSQNLAILRARRLVTERREGRRVIYRLTNPELAGWLLRGIGFLEDNLDGAERMRSVVASVKGLWGKPEEPSAG